MKTQLNKPSLEPAHVEGAHILPTIHLQQLLQTTLFGCKKQALALHVKQLKLELGHKEANNICKQATLEKRLGRFKDTVENQHNCISMLEAVRKATETKLKAKLWSAQLAAQENMGSLLAPVSGGKNETSKPKGSCQILGRA
jgi:hypothetical protein